MANDAVLQVRIGSRAKRGRAMMSPIFVDANVILRYLIGDGGDLAERARSIVESDVAYAYSEALAEAVHVLFGVCNAPQSDICMAFRKLMQYMGFYDLDVLICALNYYELSTMGFVDCLLVARKARLEGAGCQLRQASESSFGRVRRKRALWHRSGWEARRRRCSPLSSSCSSSGRS